MSTVSQLDEGASRRLHVLHVSASGSGAVGAIALGYVRDQVERGWNVSVACSSRGFLGYDNEKKQYTGVWVDSMSHSPMLMEGAFDKEKKTLTMVGNGPGMDGKPTKFKAVSTMPDDDTINFSMFMGDGKEPAFTIVYKRKKK